MQLRLQPHGTQPLYLQIAAEIRRQVAAGSLAPGTVLPTVRRLARELGCDPGTVARAYAELAREGVLVGKRGGGTRIAQELPESLDDSIRQAHLVNVVERALIEALRAGYSTQEIEAAFTLTLVRWRELRQTPQSRLSTLQVAPNRLRFVGSHDLTVELLASQVHRTYPNVDATLDFAGSLGGLIALARGEADVAGAHLLDETTGEYNVDYVRRVLPGRSTILVTLALRQQGLLLAKGNPKGIYGLADLRRRDVRLVNRQPGSGTRVLLDLHLRKLGIDPYQVSGYEQAEPTHLAVAAAVARGQADVGLGIYAAARAMDLEFYPLLQERYELVIPVEHGDHPGVQAILDVVRSEEFRQTVAALGGYDVSETGQEREVK